MDRLPASIIASLFSPSTIRATATRRSIIFRCLLSAAVTQEDLDDLGGISPFALEPAKIPQYNFKYVGKEKIDELNLYVFDVSPKVMPDAKKTKERFFMGRVWVDDQDLQIVKTKGKGVPETKMNKFPIVETYREQIDGRYWFPTYSYADEELIFDNGEPLHVRMKVRYTDFELARAKVKITEIEDPDGSERRNRSRRRRRSAQTLTRLAANTGLTAASSSLPISACTWLTRLLYSSSVEQPAVGTGGSITISIVPALASPVPLPIRWSVFLIATGTIGTPACAAM